MTASGTPSRLRRATLLLAALLHLLGAVAGPALHGWFHADPHPAGWTAQRDQAPLPAHDEQACVVCQASTGLALPAPALPPLAVSAPAEPHFAQVSLPRLSPERIRLRARAPPVSAA
jgi:hypothetical protein